MNINVFNKVPLLLALSITMQSIAFILLKLGAESYLGLSAIFFCLALLTILARAVVWQKILGKIELTTIYPFTLITQILLFIYGVTIFNEEYNFQQIVGLGIVCCGLLISFDQVKK